MDIPNASQGLYQRGQASQPAVMLVHGFTGSPYELSDLNNFLFKRGYTVLSTTLAGHASTPNDLNRCLAKDWLRGIMEDYQSLKEQNKDVFIVGVSFGGVLTLFSTIKGIIDPKAVVAVSTPLFLPKRFINRWLLPFISWFQPTTKKYWIKPEHYELYKKWKIYTEIPLKALYRSNKLVEKNRQLLKNFKQPIMIIHSQKDEVIKPSNAELLHEAVGSADKVIYWTDDPGHSFWKMNQSKLYPKILEFIQKHHD